MAFNLFKKKIIGADAIYYNGKIFTQDPDCPWAEAVACKNGRVLAVGDTESLLEMEEEETLMVDLEGEYLFPGLIDPAGHPVLAVFNKWCLYLDTKASLETVLQELKQYVSANPDQEVYFGYGFSAGLLSEKSLEEAASLLDDLGVESPVVLLADGGNAIWLNTHAIQVVKESAEQDKLPSITLPYILYTLAPFDHVALEKESLLLGEQYKALGFTSVLSCGEPDYMQGVYQQCLVDMYQCGTHLQRYFGGLLVNSNVSAKAVIHKLLQKKTVCMELDDNFNYNMLKLVIASDGPASSISLENLIDLCNECGDSGFDIHMDALGPQALIDSAAAIRKMRAAGYRRNTVVLAHSEDVEKINASAEDPIDFQELQAIETPLTVQSPMRLFPDFSRFETTQELVDFYTIHGAEILGFENQLGQIINGYYADFTVFKTNPLDVDPPRFADLEVSMTVINGLPTKVGDMSLEDDFFDELEDFDPDRVGLDGMRGLDNLGGIV